MRNKSLAIILSLLPIFILTGCSLTNNDQTDLGPGINAFEKESSESSSETMAPKQVPEFTDKDIITTFFELVSEKRFSEAITLMSPEALPDDTTKQNWYNQLNEFKSVLVTSEEPYNESLWTPIKRTYKVNLKIELNNDQDLSAIPHYGWDNGNNIRWLEIVKVDGSWRINKISLGPTLPN